MQPLRDMLLTRCLHPRKFKIGLAEADVNSVISYI